MSFAIRPIFKPRNSHIHNVDDNFTTVPNHEETKQIIMAIQKFKQKSSHDKLINPAELSGILRKSSVNPEINPAARDGVESMLARKDAESDSVDDLLDTSSDIPNTHGFSSLATNASRVSHLQSRLQKELDKELQEIKNRFRQDNTTDNSQSSSSDSSNTSTGSSNTNNASDINTENKSNNSADNARKELAKSKRNVSYGFPAQASLARGFIYRTGGMQGNAVRKTGLGIIDSF